MRERSNAWVKTKHWRVSEFVIGGWSEPYGDHGRGRLVGEPDESVALVSVDGSSSAMPLVTVRRSLAR